MSGPLTSTAGKVYFLLLTTIGACVIACVILSTATGAH